MAAPFDIVSCPPPLRSDALTLVLRNLSPDQQVATVASIARSKPESLGPFDALFIATRGEQLVAAVWAQPHAGRTATLWPPQFVGVPENYMATELIEIATLRTGEFDTAMLQAIVEPADTAAANLLRSAGLAHVADLLYLEWLPTELNRSTLLELQFETDDSGPKKRLKQVLGQTYIGSLDCPKLDSLRSLDDVLDGYRATGDFDPAMWMLVTAGGQDVGVLLLTPYQETQQMEMIYMGVVPEARGRGFGAAILRQAQASTIERRAKKLLLAVDAVNTPARKLYQRAGFREWSQRGVYVRAISGGE